MEVKKNYKVKEEYVTKITSGRCFILLRRNREDRVDRRQEENT